jgi:hypothetical protein
MALTRGIAAETATCLRYVVLNQPLPPKPLNAETLDDGGARSALVDLHLVLRSVVGVCHNLPEPLDHLADTMWVGGWGMWVGGWGWGLVPECAQ